jgi:hypothetical protein
MGGLFDVLRILETSEDHANEGRKLLEFQKGRKRIVPSHSSAALASATSTKSSMTCPKAAA